MEGCPSIFFILYFKFMRQELFKVIFKKHETIICHDSCDIKNIGNNTNDDDDVFGELFGPSYSKKKPLFVVKERNQTEEYFLKNYGNPLASVFFQQAIVVVEREEHKVSLKIFNTTRKRIRGNVFFTVSKICNYITINLNSGDYYIGSIKDYHKKRKCTKSIKKNFFSYDSLNGYKQLIRNLIVSVSNNLNPENSVGEIPHIAINTLISQIDGETDNINVSPIKRVLLFYFKKKNIKYPDNFISFYNQHDVLFNLKKLKKHNLNIVDTFMAEAGFSGKKIKKALHYSNVLNVNQLKRAISMFGYDWVVKDEEFLYSLLNSKESLFWHGVNLLNINEFFNKKELRNLYELYRSSFINKTINLLTIYDHISYFLELKDSGETQIKWRRHSSIDDFMKEHLDWSDKLEFYRRGKYKRIYPNYFYEELKTIVVDDVKYFPIILDTTNNFNEESLLQSNCVKSYIGRPESFIVSLRKGDINSENRATIEYRINKDERDKIIAKNVQCLGRFNQRLFNDWNRPVIVLDSMVSKIFKDNRYETLKLEKEFVNGNKLFSDSEWIEDRLKWTYKPIMGNNYYE